MTTTAPHSPFESAPKFTNKEVQRVYDRNQARLDAARNRTLYQRVLDTLKWLKTA